MRCLRSHRVVSVRSFFLYKTETHNIVKLFKHQLLSYTQSRQRTTFKSCSSVNSVNRDLTLENESEQRFLKQLSDSVFYREDGDDYDLIRVSTGDKKSEMKDNKK